MGIDLRPRSVEMRRAWLPSLLYGLTGLLLVGGLLASPDPNAWAAEDQALLAAAFARGAELGTPLFPGWRPGEGPVLLTKGRVNYLINYPTHLEAPPGRELAVEGMRVRRLTKPEVPSIGMGVVEVDGEPVVLLTGRRQFEQVVGGLMAEQGLMRGGEAEMVKRLMRTEGPTRFRDEEFIPIMLHEAFHLYQWPQLESWADGMPTEYPEERLWRELYADQENNRLQDQEAVYLLTAIQAATPEESRAAVTAFLEVRAQRLINWQRRLGEEGARAYHRWEQIYEWAEGLARYVEIRLAFDGAEELIAQVGEPVDSLSTRERVYRMGAGQALVLDRLAPNWRAKAMAGAFLGELLEAALTGE